MEFLGLDSEESQTNFLAQHDKYLSINKMSIISDRDMHERSEELKVSNNYSGFFKQSTPKNQTLQPTQAKMNRRTTYYGEAPKIIENYKALKNVDGIEPNRKMFKVTVVEYK